MLDEYADGIRSVAEAEARRKLILLPIPTPLFNPDLYTTDGSFLCRPDAYWPDAGLAFEVDSMRHHGDMVTWERTQRRHGSMTAHDLAILHASPLRVRTDWPRLGAEVVRAYHFGLRRGAPNIRVIPAA